MLQYVLGLCSTSKAEVACAYAQLVAAIDEAVSMPERF
jgi:hypothetical protein